MKFLVQKLPLILAAILLGLPAYSYSTGKKAQIKYSVWLSPSGEAYDKLHHLICTLAKQYAAPCFEPHVTIVGDLETSLPDITRTAKKLANQTRPLAAKFVDIEWTPDNYWRSFILRAEDTPAFTKLYDDTCKLIGKCHTRPFHMSLMYTKLPAADKEAIKTRLLSTGILQEVPLNRLRVCTSGDVPEDWKCPVEFILQ